MGRPRPFVLMTPPPVVLPPRLYVYWKLPGDTAWTWQAVVIDPPLSLTRDATGVAHLSMPQPISSDPLTLRDLFGGPSQPINSIVLGSEMRSAVSNGVLQIDVNSASMTSRAALQSGWRSDDVTAGSSGNPQTCISVTLPQQSPEDPTIIPLVPGQDYAAECSSFLVRLVQWQTLNWVVDIANVGPVSLSVDKNTAMPVLDRKGNPLVAGQLTPGLYRIWNDGANWRVSEL